MNISWLIGGWTKALTTSYWTNSRSDFAISAISVQNDYPGVWPGLLHRYLVLGLVFVGYL